MKAVVLVGGEGTRLRPLTETIPKPLLPLMGRAFLHHVLDHLAAHGVHEVVLSSSYLEEAFTPFIEERHGDPMIAWITERSPLGTGGAVVNALGRVGSSPFFVLNGDILTDLDLTAMARAHDAAAAAATISTMHVDDARPFGLVMADGDRRVREFREKPAEPVPSDINAGTYILDPAALSGFERGVVRSIEREIFPQLIERGERVYAFPSQCYWLDLGTPEKYLQAHFDMLEGKTGDDAPPAPSIDATASVDLRAHVGRWVVIGPGAVVGANAEVDEAVLLAGAVVEEGAHVRSSILGPGSRVGRGAGVLGSVLGEGARVAEGGSASGTKVRA